jgi:broad specificity phosphatase PhoE
MLLLVARHGETRGNREKRFQGQQNYPLTPGGRRQALKLQGPLKALRPQAVYASDLDRAVETAMLAAASLQVPLYRHPLFREYSFGIMEGHTREEVKSLYPGLAGGFGDGYLPKNTPGAEEAACFLRRLQWTRDYFAAFPGEYRCLLVSHGRFINAFLSLLICGRDTPPYPFPVGNASLSALRLETARTELLFFNDTCHLEKM